MTALMAWPQDGGIAYSGPGINGRYPTTRAAIHGAKLLAEAGDLDAARALARVIAARWGTS